MGIDVRVGDAREVLAEMPAESMHCVVTSPPYWGLRQYHGEAGMIGREPTLKEHLDSLVEVFREVRRVMRPDATLWLNYGDAYANDAKWGGSTGGKHAAGLHGKTGIGRAKRKTGFKPKDLMGLAWRVAFALQDDGWWLRRDIVWHKPNPQPESAKDRPTNAHEFVFLMTKAAHYYYDHEAVKEPVSGGAHARAPQHNSAAARKARAKPDAKSTPTAERRGMRPAGVGPKTAEPGSGIRNNSSTQAAVVDLVEKRALRDVWVIPTYSFPEAHFATFPPALVEPCIKAGCPRGGTVLDPFGGSGTVGMVADRLQRDAILIEISPDYADMARRRVTEDAPLFAEAMA